MTKTEWELTLQSGLYLLAIERTGWRRWVYGRWVYKSEPFRRDIQRACARQKYSIPLKKGRQLWPDDDSRFLPESNYDL